MNAPMNPPRDYFGNTPNNRPAPALLPPVELVDCACCDGTGICVVCRGSGGIVMEVQS